MYFCRINLGSDHIIQTKKTWVVKFCHFRTPALKPILSCQITYQPQFIPSNQAQSILTTGLVYRGCGHMKYVLTLRPVVGDDGHHLPSILQGCGRLFVGGVTEVDAVHLKNRRSFCVAAAAFLDSFPCMCMRTDTSRSPFLSSPQRSAGPPARMKEMKIPSPSSPPTMLKPSPVAPRCSTTFLGSLHERTALRHHSPSHTPSPHSIAGLTERCRPLPECSWGLEKNAPWRLAGEGAVPCR